MANTQSESPPAPAAVKKKKTRAPSKKSRKSLPPRPVPARLEAADIERARTTARAWDRHVRYAPTDYFVHATFGVGYVTDATPEFITCLFEGGETRRLIHAR